MKGIIEGGDRGMIYKELLKVLEISDKGDTDVQKYVNESLDVFDNMINDSCVYYLEISLCSLSHHVRQMSLILLKKGIIKKWLMMDENLRLIIKNGVMKLIYCNDIELRNMISSLYVSLLIVEGYDNWSDSISYLLSILTCNNDEIVLENVISTLILILEDSLINNRIKLTDNFINYIKNIFLPNIFKLSTMNNTLIIYNCRVLYVTLENKLIYDIIFTEYFELYWNILGIILNINNDYIYKFIIKSIYRIWDIYPFTILESSNIIFPILISYCGDNYDYTIQIDVLDLWVYILRGIEVYSIELRLLLIDKLKIDISNLIKILIKNTKYSSLDYMSMDKSHLEDDNYNIKDDDQDLYYNNCGDNNTTTWGNTWTVRKGSALLLDVLSIVYGNDNDVISIILMEIQNNLESLDWEIKESAILSLSAIGKGSIKLLSPHLPKVIDYLLIVINDKIPLLRIITCWCISRFVIWLYYPENNNYLKLSINAILDKILDKNKRVQESACTAFTSFEENGGHLLIPFLDDILNVLIYALNIYQLRNHLILYDVISTLIDNIPNHTLINNHKFNQLVNGVFYKINTTNSNTPQFKSLLECISYTIKCLGGKLNNSTIIIILYNKLSSIIIETLIEYKKCEYDHTIIDIIETCLDELSTIITNNIKLPILTHNLKIKHNDWTLLQDYLTNTTIIKEPKLNDHINETTPPEVQSNSLRPAVSSPPEVQSTSVPLAVEASSNYLSLKGRATPGDRGEISETIYGSRGEVNREGTTPSGMESGVSTGPQVEPGSDLRELEGEVNRRADGRTTSGGRATTASGTDVDWTSGGYDDVLIIDDMVSINFRCILLLCCSMDINCVLQISLALIGDMIWNDIDILNNYIINILLNTINYGVISISNNSIWCIGIISIKLPHYIDIYIPYIVDILSNLLNNNYNEIMLKQNICITLGRLCLTFPYKMGLLLNKFIFNLCNHLINTKNDPEKAQAINGITLSLLTNPTIISPFISDVINTIINYPPTYPELDYNIKQLINLYHTQYPTLYNNINNNVKHKIHTRFQ